MNRKPDPRDAVPSLTPDKAGDIRTQLERILGSHLFRGSRRCQGLLRHITDQTLVGDTSSLKERTLGIQVFGRLPDYDTNQDPVVRATAAEIRKKLAQYYQEAEHESEPRIDLVSGSYVAEFRFDVENARVAKSRRRNTFISIGAAAGILFLTLALAVPRWSRSNLELFWAPIFKTPGTVLVCMGQPITYNLRSAQAQDEIQGAEAAGPNRSPGADEVIHKKDLLILGDRYVALGDAICLARLTGFLELHGKPYRVRGERSTSFADLSDGPAVLIAAFDNQWTIRTAGQLRFTFAKDSAHETDMVLDRLHPENTAWKLTGAWPDWDVENDYAIVSRVLDTIAERPVVIAAGITQYGTMAAGDFLSDSKSFSEAVAQLPAGWEKKNMQIVLRVPVTNRVPGRPRVLAMHVW